MTCGKNSVSGGARRAAASTVGGTRTDSWSHTQDWNACWYYASVDRYTCRTTHFHMHSHCTVQTTCAPGSRGTRLKTNCVPKTFTHPRAMFHPTPHSTLNTSTSSLSPISHVLLSSSSPNPDLLSTHPFIRCEDPRQDGTSAEFFSTTGCEPKRIELNRILANPQNQIIDDQDDTEESGVKPLSYNQSLIHSAYDSAETHCDATRLGPRRRTIT